MYKYVCFTFTSKSCKDKLLKIIVTLRSKNVQIKVLNIFSAWPAVSEGLFVKQLMTIFSLTLLLSASGECLDSELNALSLKGGPLYF